MVIVIMATRRSTPWGDTMNILIFSIMMVPMTVAQSEKPLVRTDFDHAVRDAINLTADDVAKLEASLKRDPKAMATRFKIIGYYLRKAEVGQQPKYVPFVMGLIENQPESNLGADITMMMLHGPFEEAAAKAWLEAAKTHPDDPQVIGNAGAFLVGDLFQTQNRPQGESLLKRARTLAPNEPRWSEHLGSLYDQERSMSRVPTASRDAAKMALEAYETAYRLRPPTERDLMRDGGNYPLHDLTRAAFDAHEPAKAKTYATAYLKSANAQEKSWNYGNALFDAHTTLGRIALDEGDIKTAKRELLEAGKTPGSPQLNSFGPSMSLAQALLEKGETETVITYLDLCRKFWSLGKDRLTKWTNDIRADHKPDFGVQAQR